MPDGCLRHEATAVTKPTPPLHRGYVINVTDIHAFAIVGVERTIALALGSWRGKVNVGDTVLFRDKSIVRVIPAASKITVLRAGREPR